MHLTAIAEIYAGYVWTSTATFELTPPGVDEWTRRFTAITDAGLPFLVAEVDGQIAGYAYCSPWKPRPAYRQTVENSIYLAPWATGRGVGGALLDALLDRCRAGGLREVVAVIADPERNTASPALHRGRGFADAGLLRNVGYKHEQWLDTLLLQKSLVQSPGVRDRVRPGPAARRRTPVDLAGFGIDQARKVRLPET